MRCASPSHIPVVAAVQGGFVLMEAAIAVVVFMLLTVAGLAALEFDRRVSRGRFVGEQMLQINAGLQRYLRENRAALLTLPAECSTTTFSTGTTSTPGRLAPTQGADPCTLVVDRSNGQGAPVTVANGFQPSVDDLVRLNELPAGTGAALSLPHAVLPGYTVKENTRPDGATSGSDAVARLAMLITCSDSRITGPAAPAACQPDTPASARRLSGMVFNTQPYYASSGKMPWGVPAQLAAAMNAMGARGFLSHPGMPASRSVWLMAQEGSASRRNPVAGSGGAGGAAGILAAVTDVDDSASGASECTPDGTTMCRDGSAKPTASWDFDGKGIGNIGALKFAPLETNVLQARLAASAPNNVEGPLLIGGDVRVRDATLKADSMIPPTAKETERCDPAKQTFAQTADQRGVLSCIQGKWVSVTKGRLIPKLTYNCRNSIMAGYGGIGFGIYGEQTPATAIGRLPNGDLYMDLPQSIAPSDLLSDSQVHLPSGGRCWVERFDTFYRIVVHPPATPPSTLEQSQSVTAVYTVLD